MRTSKAATTAPWLALAGVIALAGCKPLENPDKPAAPPPGAKSATGARKPPELPELKRPRPVPAERVVHLFYSSNVGGMTDPYG